MLLQSLFGLLTAYLLYAMLAMPFAVWAGRSAHAGTIAGKSLYPGHARTLFLFVLPMVLVGYGLTRGFDNRSPDTPYQPDEWGQLLFLAMAPCLGMIYGSFFGFLQGWSERDHRPESLNPDI